MTLRARLSGLVRVRPSTPPPEAGERHATWLELFFDLVFVLALSAATAKLDQRGNSSLREIAISFALFVIIQWAWVGHSFYDTRFDPDDLGHRMLVFLAIAGAGTLALGVTDVPRSPLLPIGYLMVRGALILMYLRVCTTGQAAREICTIYLIGFSAGWLIWLASLAFPAEIRPFLWGVGLGVELLTPWVGLRTLSRYPVDVSHLPERIGQFTVIILGSTLTDLVVAIANPHPPTRVLVAAAAAFVVPVCVWSVYATFVTSRAVRPRLGSGQIFTYLHVPYDAALLFLGWALGTTLHQVVIGSAHLPAELRSVLAGSLAFWMYAGLGLQWHTRGGGLPWLRIAISTAGTGSVVAVTALVDQPIPTLLLIPAIVVVYSVVVIRNVRADIIPRTEPA